MILDDGICTVFEARDMSLSGEMPRKVYIPIWASWYARLAYETSPARPTDGRSELRTDARIRILQCTTVRQDDVVILEHLERFDERSQDAAVYRVTRAWHGTDDDGPTQITDLTLEVYKP